jgi:stage II sporulation protein D
MVPAQVRAHGGRHESMRSRVLTAAAGLLSVLAGATVGPAASAAAESVSAVPASRVLSVQGHGWGHGRGMSQNGAYGAAARYHLSSEQILGFYYPGTRAMKIANRPVRVQLRSQEAAGGATGVVVENPGQLALRDDASKASYLVPSSTSSRWRVQPTTAGLRVEYLTAAQWRTWRTFAGPLRLDAKSAPSTHVVSPVDRRYTSTSLEVLQQRSASGQRLARQTLVATVSMESYVRGVVPLESPTSWPLASLQAQAVAARSYTAYKLDHVRAGAAYDICDTTACQVYGGDNAFNDSSDRAVASTAGVIRTYAGKAILAEFSASNGGWTTSGQVPYLPAKADPYDGAVPSTSHAWTATLPTSALEKAYPRIGRLASVQVLTRDGRGDWGGRVLTVRLTGDKGDVVASGQAVYHAAAWPTSRTGLRSPWWTLAVTTAARAASRVTTQPTQVRQPTQPTTSGSPSTS